jgi:hypothetical protein
MLPKNKADLIIMIVIFFIIIGATAGGTFLHIRNRSIELELVQKKQQLAGLKQELESLKNKASNNRTTLARVDSQSAPLVPFDRNQQEIFRGELERISNDNHVKIIKSELATASSIVKGNPGYRVSQWQLVLTGNYRGLTGFLGALPRNGRLVMISSVKVIPEYRKGNQYQLITRLSLDIISKPALE